MSELLPASPLNTYPDEYVSLTTKEMVKMGINKELAKSITKLPTNTYPSYLKIVNDEGLLVLINYVLNNSEHGVALELFRLYQTIISKSFNTLIEIMVNSENFGLFLYNKISWRLMNIDESIPYSILRGIYDTVIHGLRDVKQVSNIVIESPKNVQIARDIEALNLTSYPLLLQYFTNFSHFNKTSASESIVFSAKFTQRPGINYLKAFDTLAERQVFFKIFPIKKMLNERAQLESVYGTIGLEAEASIYEQLGKLVEYGVTPNILCSVWSGELSNFDTKFIQSPLLPEEFKRACVQNVYDINVSNNVLDPELLWVDTGIIMTLAGEYTLNQILKIITPAERKQIMFQLLYTLYVFEQLQISHGDLHSGNIFIQDIPETVYNFEIGGRHFRLATTKLVKIYDFDHTSILKTTNLVLDINDAFTINAVLNPLRAEGSFINQLYAEVNIFNKHLDILILLSFGICGKVKPEHFEFFGGIDPEFNEFMKFVLRGFYEGNPIANETIYDTYARLLENEENRVEASRIFNMNIKVPLSLKTLKIQQEILDGTWASYYMAIIGHYGRIVKNFEVKINNNNMWIPDELIVPKIEILGSDYFREYIVEEPVNVTRGIVFSIDNRILP